MFTGIVEEIGKVSSVSRAQGGVKLKIASQNIGKGLNLGDSVCVNGVCLTVTALNSGLFDLDVVEESLSRSTLGRIKAGGKVNLERALKADSRLGGHLVSGHIDGVGHVMKMARHANSVELEIDCPVNLLKYMVEKGSVAIDGVSLTISAVSKTSFKVSLIPTTLNGTTLGSLRERDDVNLEADVLGKYVEKNISALKRPSSKINEPFLREAGYRV